MKNLELIPLSISGCYKVVPRIIQDHRGEFVKLFQKNFLDHYGFTEPFREQYISKSHFGVLRGMHFQSPPYAHDKLVFCLEGRVMDGIVDLRLSSPTFLKALTLELDDISYNGLIIPKGVAHGFLTLTSNATMLYNVTTEYQPSHDSGILWNSCGINWSIPNPSLSERDLNFQTLSDFNSPFWE